MQEEKRKQRVEDKDFIESTANLRQQFFEKQKKNQKKAKQL